MAKTFDEHELLERVDNDREFLAETVEMLVSDGPGLLAQIRDSLAAHDGPGVGRHAHALKGMISNFCAAEAQACALRLEQMGKGGDLSGGAAMCAEMESRLSELIGELSAFVKGGG